MKRKGGDGGRTAMAFNKKDAERTEMDDLCSKLTSLVPQEYRLDTASQVSSDMPSQLMHATTYIKDLWERVEMLKPRRDDCRSRIQGTASSSNATTTETGSCGPHDITVQVQFSGATHFDVNLTTSSRKGVQLHKVVRSILQDESVEVIEANSSHVDESRIVYVLKCKAVSSEAVMDATMVATRLTRLLAESFAEPDRVAV
uniref:Uncharacterized protein n=1 Tax=Avena sativa TaxID=4498 RepID=A0ACD5VC30_AVESA